MQPDAGEIRIKGRRVNEIPPQRRSTVVVFQDYALFPHLTVFENVAYGLRRRGLKGAEMTRRVQQMLSFLGLTGLDRLSPLQLSGGQQQRVALARALAVEPDVLLLDEPLSNLDAKLRVRVRTELKEIQRTLGKTTILVTHDQEEALSISDRIAVMEAGRIRQTGTPIEVYARPADAASSPISSASPTSSRQRYRRWLGWGRAGYADRAFDGDKCRRADCRPMRDGGAAPHRTASLRDAPAWPSPATLRSSSFLGELRRHHLRVGELSLVVDQLPEQSGEVPAEPWLAVNPAVGFHILPAMD